MTIIDAFGQVYGFIVAVFTSPIFFVFLGVLLVAVGIICCVVSFGGYEEQDYLLATFVLIFGFFGLGLPGVSLIIWAASSASAFEWIAR